MRFEWDQEKDILNNVKHDVSFDEAKTIWADDDSIEYFDDKYLGLENRFVRIGKGIKSRYLLVVFIEDESEEGLALLTRHVGPVRRTDQRVTETVGRR